MCNLIELVQYLRKESLRALHAIYNRVAESEKLLNEAAKFDQAKRLIGVIRNVGHLLPGLHQGIQGALERSAIIRYSGKFFVVVLIQSRVAVHLAEHEVYLAHRDAENATQADQFVVSLLVVQFHVRHNQQLRLVQLRFQDRNAHHEMLFSALVDFHGQMVNRLQRLLGQLMHLIRKRKIT